jgi:hypothetical protein
MPKKRNEALAPFRKDIKEEMAQKRSLKWALCLVVQK